MAGTADKASRVCLPLLAAVIVLVSVLMELMQLMKEGEQLEYQLYQKQKEQQQQQQQPHSTLKPHFLTRLNVFSLNFRVIFTTFLCILSLNS